MAEQLPRYRTGKRNPRNIYLVLDDVEVHVACAFDPAFGPVIVEALNLLADRERGER
jgi:hypothetical protein